MLPPSSGTTFLYPEHALLPPKRRSTITPHGGKWNKTLVLLFYHFLLSYFANNKHTYVRQDRYCSLRTYNGTLTHVHATIAAVEMLPALM